MWLYFLYYAVPSEQCECVPCSGTFSLPPLALIFRMLRPGIALIKICQAGQLCGFRGKWWAIFYNLIRGGAADFSGKSEPPRSSAGNGEQKIRRLRRPSLDWLPPLPPPPPILISMASSPITPPFPPSLPISIFGGCTYAIFYDWVLFVPFVRSTFRI